MMISLFGYASSSTLCELSGRYPPARRIGPSQRSMAKSSVSLTGVLQIHVVGDARLDQVDVVEAQLLRLANHAGELRDGVVHAHALERAPRAQAETDALRPDGVADGLHDLADEARPVPNAAAVLVRAGIADVLRKAVDEVPVRAVELDAVEDPRAWRSSLRRRSPAQSA